MPHRGIEPVSVSCQSDALLTELHPQPIFAVTAAAPSIWTLGFILSNVDNKVLLYADLYFMCVACFQRPEKINVSNDFL